MGQVEIDLEWESLVAKLTKTLGKKPNLDAILYLIGIQELGKGIRRFSKEQKQDLMHLGICKVLSLAGYYVFEGNDDDGWPHYKLQKSLPQFKIDEQEKLLKMYILEYFSEL
ncbi:hypothetical protein RCC89_02175 [Cytophagaceae bacterium ABcell3]|nr:hypothetical protein RCC89_02175 [Cytophagaceae bacterium ABcell3]